MAKSNTTEIKVEWHKATEAPKRMCRYTYFLRWVNENIRFVV